MTGDLAVTARPAAVAMERPPDEPAARSRARPATGVISSAPNSSNAAESSGVDGFGASRLKTLLTDGAVQVRAHQDDASARLVLQVVDRATGEVIEQYPPEELLRFYAALRESLGALVDERA